MRYRFRRHLLGALAALTLAAPANAQAQAPFQCPRVGGDLIFALEARVPGLDWHVSNSTASRNVVLNVFESLVTRDENMNPTLELAESMTEAPDGLSYTFRIRDGVTFHNGKALTSADVAASFERYRRVGVDRSILDVVERWETPDPRTFILRLREARPTFIEQLSAFTVPVAIIPSETAGAEPNQLPIVGTGPFRLDEFRADSFVRLRRFDGYRPDTRHAGLQGFGGFKQACVDTVTFRMMPEAAARTAALEVGEIHGVEDVPPASQARLRQNANIRMERIENFWMQVTYPNFSQPPTDNPRVRQAILAAMDFEEIMEAAAEGQGRLVQGFQHRGQIYFSDAGSRLLNQKNRDRARQLLREAGYNNERVVLLTNREFPVMYNTSLAMQQQLRAVGINAELLILDWPAALQMSIRETQGWNFFFTGWITVVALGGPQTMRQLAPPAQVHKPREPDPVFVDAFNRLSNGRTLAERQAAFAQAQERVIDQVMAIPFGVIPKAQAVRANVEGFRAYFNTRMSNIWIRP
jgi:peptide/nickel transport system substrate-binding protein